MSDALKCKVSQGLDLDEATLQWQNNGCTTSRCLDFDSWQLVGFSFSSTFTK